MVDHTTPMALDKIDKVLPELRKKLEASTDNLLALVDMITYKRLTGEGGYPQVTITGTTKAQVEPAVDAFRELWLHRQLLWDKLEEAEKLRAGIGILNKADHIQQISDILQGASIKLPSSQVPLEQRGLLSASEVQQAVSVDRLLEAMDKAWNEANHVVHAVDAAWKMLKSKLAGALTEITQLQALAQTVAQPSCPELATAQSQIAQLLKLIDADALGVQQGFADDVEPLMAAARQRLNSLKSERDQVEAGLTDARNQLATVRAEHDKGKDAHRKRVEKVTVADADKLPVPFEDKVVDDLDAWLGRLDNTFATSNWKAVSVGLVSFNAQCKARLEHAQAVFKDNQPLVEKRYELRGLLDALKAKAANSGLSEDAQVSSLYQSAHNLLYTRPTPLVEAEKAVKAYQAAIS